MSLSTRLCELFDVVISRVYDDFMVSNKTLAQQLMRRFLKQYKDNTRASYTNDLICWWRWCRDTDRDFLKVTRVEVEYYKRYLEEKGLAAATICRRFSTLTSFYESLLYYPEALIKANPFRGVKKPKRSPISTTTGLTYLEFASLLSHTSKEGGRDHAVIVGMGLLGLRVSELCSLRVEDLDYARGHRVVTFTGKGSKKATLPLPVPVARAFEEVAGDRQAGWLIPDRRGDRLDRNKVARIVARTSKRAGIRKRITPHSLRHTYITQLLDANVPLRDVQHAARHSDPRMTMRYDRNRQSLDRHASYTLATHMASAFEDF